MNTTTNAGLLVLATGLVAKGAVIFSSNWLLGTALNILGAAVFVAYELLPA